MEEKGMLVEIKNLTKKFPGVTALDDFSLGIKKGEVHAMLGENGAGKSTLVKILGGAFTPNEGEIIYRGNKFEKLTPKKSSEIGIRIIYQELNLVSELTVTENIFLAHEKTRGKFIKRLDKNAMKEKTRDIMDRLNIKLPLNEPVKNLRMAAQQLTEICKALAFNVELLILDEPTSSLTDNEIEKLFNIIEQLKEEGTTVLFISHKLEEIFRISDRITVLRDGRKMGTGNTIEFKESDLIKMMVGREVRREKYFRIIDYNDRKELLKVKNLTTEQVQEINFSLYEGEILGVAGLVGAGRTDLARAIFGADRIIEGEIYIEGEKVNISSPKEAILNGISLLPEDRKSQGILLELGTKENLTIANLDYVIKNKIISLAREKKLAWKVVKELNIKTAGLDQKAKNLSGGNQQKTVLGKWLQTNSKIMIFDEPTKGIDIQAKEEIHKLLRELANEGKGIMMISSELPEILAMSDRIMVMAEGKIQAILLREEGKDMTEEKIMSHII